LPRSGSPVRVRFPAPRLLIADEETPMSQCRMFCAGAVLLLAVAAAGMSGAEPAPLALAPGDKAPLMIGANAAGENVRLFYDAHKLTIVNFWATWCEPCRLEMPALQRLYEEHGEAGLDVVGVLYDNATNETMQEFAGSLGVKYALIRPRVKLIRNWGLGGALPVTFLVDSKGVVLRRYLGSTKEQIEGLVRDTEAALEGRPLEAMVIPEKPSIATEEDRRKAIREENERNR
jgi:thiol-disulfide isomerase/thioredoxin